MTTYWSILEKMPGSKLRLTKIDDEIHEHFKQEFPDYDLKATINEDEMKSKAGKERWRNFINAYENKVDDYNFGTMLRANPAWEYGEKETIFGEFYICGSAGVGEGLGRLFLLAREVVRSLFGTCTLTNNLLQRCACNFMLLRLRGTGLG